MHTALIMKAAHCSYTVGGHIVHTALMKARTVLILGGRSHCAKVSFWYTLLFRAAHCILTSATGVTFGQ